MMRVFLDTNILIDIVARRSKFYKAASNVFNLGILGSVELVTTSMSYATCVYICQREMPYQDVIMVLQQLDSYVKIAPMNGAQCQRALHADAVDFEDMLQYEAALGGGCDVVVTRNGKHFPKDGIPIMTPEQFLQFYMDEESE
ncbi:MAG: PIN domain-containing protein [Prevotella sp.]|nr:PIN domain-containing protein [Prevotella sp.]